MLVSFTEEEDQSISVVPIERVRDCLVKDLKEGVVCKVEWSDRNIDSAEVLATGVLLYLESAVCSLTPTFVLRYIFTNEDSMGGERERERAEGGETIDDGEKSVEDAEKEAKEKNTDDNGTNQHSTCTCI